MPKNDLNIIVKVNVSLWHLLKLILLRFAFGRLSHNMLDSLDKNKHPVCADCGCTIMHDDWFRCAGGTFCPICWEKLNGKKQ